MHPQPGLVNFHVLGVLFQIDLRLSYVIEEYLNLLAVMFNNITSSKCCYLIIILTKKTVGMFSKTNIHA